MQGEQQRHGRCGDQRQRQLGDRRTGPAPPGHVPPLGSGAMPAASPGSQLPRPETTAACGTSRDPRSPRWRSTRRRTRRPRRRRAAPHAAGQAGAHRAAVQRDAGQSRDRGGPGDDDRPQAGRRVIHGILHQWAGSPGSSGNPKNSGRRGASPEGACRVECRCAAIGHPKVLSGRLGCQGIRPWTVRPVNTAATSGSDRSAPSADRRQCGCRPGRRILGPHRRSGLLAGGAGSMARRRAAPVMKWSGPPFD